MSPRRASCLLAQFHTQPARHAVQPACTRTSPRVYPTFISPRSLRVDLARVQVSGRKYVNKKYMPLTAWLEIAAGGSCAGAGVTASSAIILNRGLRSRVHPPHAKTNCTSGQGGDEKFAREKNGRELVLLMQVVVYLAYKTDYTRLNPRRPLFLDI